MMNNAKIEIAMWPRGPFSQKNFLSLLERYHLEKKSRQVNARWHNEQNPWSDVSQTMIHRSGPDITEVGSSWVESLVATNSLRPFSMEEFQSFGGDMQDAFARPAWKKDKDASLVYSIPYTIDTRQIYYRRDLLAQAGVDEKNAFTTPQNFLKTLESLKRSGVQAPLVIPITSARMNLSFVSSWLWSADADFINTAGNRATFDTPQAIAAIADYFRAVDYIAPEFRQMTMAETDAAFCKGDAAIVLSGSWLFYTIQQEVEYGNYIHVKDNLGIAMPLGQGYNGGTHLVIWQHCIQHEAAFDLIHFLTSPQIQADLSVNDFVLSARLEAAQLTPFANDPNYQTLIQTALSGRSYGASPLWNIVEARLSNTLVQLWPEYFNTSGVDANTFLEPRLAALARRINIALED